MVSLVCLVVLSVCFLSPPLHSAIQPGLPACHDSHLILLSNQHLCVSANYHQYIYPALIFSLRRIVSQSQRFVEQSLAFLTAKPFCQVRYFACLWIFSPFCFSVPRQSTSQPTSHFSHQQLTSTGPTAQPSSPPFRTSTHLPQDYSFV